MELYPPSLLSIDAEGSSLYILRASDDTEALGELRNRIPMRHPYRATGANPFQQGIMLMTDREVSTSILTAIAGLYTTSSLMN